jgi:hypothetical protein
MDPIGPTINNSIITAISALIGAIIGGSVTYLVAYKRQKYELRRDAYLAFLECRIEGCYPSPIEWTKIPTFSRELLLAKYKIDLVGSKNIKVIAAVAVRALYPNAKFIGEGEDDKREVLSNIEKLTSELDIQRRWKAFETICDNKLKPAVQEELENWWPFDHHPNQDNEALQAWRVRILP